MIEIFVRSGHPLRIGDTNLKLGGVFKCVLKNEIESYGWKWENAPINSWDGYFADYIKLAGYDIRRQPFDIFYGGYISTGSLNGAGARGNYWSSAAYANNYAYDLTFYSASVYPSNNFWRSLGFSIRCLAR